MRSRSNQLVLKTVGLPVSLPIIYYYWQTIQLFVTEPISLAVAPIVAYVVVFTNVAPAGQEQGWHISLQGGSVERGLRGVGDASDKAMKGRTKQVRRRLGAMLTVWGMKERDYRVPMPLYIREGCLPCLHWCLWTTQPSRSLQSVWQSDQSNESV